MYVRTYVYMYLCMIYMESEREGEGGREVLSSRCVCTCMYETCTYMYVCTYVHDMYVCIESE